MKFDFVKGSIKFIRGKRYPSCNSVLVDGPMRAVIDSSSDRDQLQLFKDQGQVDYLIASHAHEDHLAFNYLFPESQFCAHADDARYFEDMDALIDCYGEMPEEDREKWRHFLREDCHYQPRKVDHFLRDGVVLDLGDVKMEILHTPGHSKGHLSFYFVPEKVMFTADLDLTKAGPYYADRGSDIEELIHSLRRLKTYEVHTYLTAHGKGVFEGDPVYIDRYLEIVFLREQKLVNLLRTGPKTLDQVTQVGIIYGPNPAPLSIWDLRISEKAMMIKHLDRLVRLNRVTKDKDLYVLNE